MCIRDRNTATLRASAPLKNTPSWTLVLAEQDYVHKEEWTSFKQRLLFIFLGCSITVFLIITQLVGILTTRIRESEEKRHNLLAEAEHSNKLASIGRLAAGVAHEINNPLAIINQKSGLIGDYLEVTPSFQYKDNILKSLTVINDSVLRCKNITHRLLGFARRTDAVLEEIDLNRLVGDVILFLENESLHNRIRIRTSLEGGLPPVQSDRTQLQQIFLNIINNAIDAIVHDGNIDISSTTLSDGVEIKIKDDGPGMTPEVLEHIFEPFFTTKELGKGTGLGLSITYGLIQKLGGTITVESAVGNGTAFTIHIPFTSICLLYTSDAADE
jgi:two-component system NtrC family sensor kinase